MTAREARNTHDTAHNAGLTDLKLEKANARVSGLIQATAMTLSSSARNPEVKPRETWASLSGISGWSLRLKIKTNTALWAILHTENDARSDLHVTSEPSSSPPIKVYSIAATSTSFVRTISSFRTSLHVTCFPLADEPIHQYLPRFFE